jgi:hypothetical protein
VGEDRLTNERVSKFIDPSGVTFHMEGAVS